LLWLLPGTPTCAIVLTQNHFGDPNQHILTCLHPIVLSTAGDALTEEASSHCQMPTEVPARLNQQAPANHPLDTHNDSVVNEECQQSSHKVSPCVTNRVTPHYG